jgi:hypothetical protein
MLRRGKVFVTAVVAATAAVSGLGSSGVASARPDVSGVSPLATPVTLNVTKQGNGRVSSSPPGIDCGATCSAGFNAGTIVVLTATPVPGWGFWGWTGACTGPSTTCTVNLSTPTTTVQAVFIGIDGARARLQGTWRRSVLRGTLTVSGAVSHEAQLTFTLTAPGRSRRTFNLTVPAPGGSFSRSFALPGRGFFPGTYGLVIGGTILGSPFPPQQVSGLRLAGPREGVIARAWVSSLASSAPVTRLPRGTSGVAGRFLFGARPARGSRITASWFHNGRLLGTAGKPPTRTVVAVLRIPGGMPRGSYRCVLRVGRRAIAQVTVRIA